eukprot:SAG25_NODE_2257_length_1780_cov_1.491374_2_plen_169_part_00
MSVLSLIVAETLLAGGCSDGAGFFVHVMATGSTMRPAAHVGILIHVFDVLCKKNPVSHDVQSSALSFPQLAPAAAVPLAHVHTGWMIHALVYRVVMLAFEVTHCVLFHSFHSPQSRGGVSAGTSVVHDPVVTTVARGRCGNRSNPEGIASQPDCSAAPIAAVYRLAAT